MHDHAAIMNAILDGYVLPVRGEHGVVHWARVLDVMTKKGTSV